MAVWLHHFSLCVCACVRWGGGLLHAYHNPLAWSILVYKHMVGDLAGKWVHLCYTLAVPL